MNNQINYKKIHIYQTIKKNFNQLKMIRSLSKKILNKKPKRKNF